MHQSVGVGQIELCRIEGPVGPFDHTIVFFVSRIGHRLDELGIAIGATDIVGRAGILAVKTDGELQAEVGPGQVLDNNVVLPAVAKVVLKDEASLFSEGLEDGHALFVDLAFGIVVEAHANAFVANQKDVQM